MKGPQSNMCYGVNPTNLRENIRDPLSYFCRHVIRKKSLFSAEHHTITEGQRNQIVGEGTHTSGHTKKYP